MIGVSDFITDRLNYKNERHKREKDSHYLNENKDFLKYKIRQHDSALRLKSIISKKEFDSYFKFVFVRNPWDRLVSMYHFFMQWQKKSDKSFLDKSGFAEWLQEDFSVNTKIKFKDQIYRKKTSQLMWLCDEDGKILVDFIGRFEQLQEDFKQVMSIIGFEKELSTHKNFTNHNLYREYYDLNTMELVGKWYKEDIDLFRYKF